MKLCVPAALLLVTGATAVPIWSSAQQKTIQFFARNDERIAEQLGFHMLATNTDQLDPETLLFNQTLKSNETTQLNTSLHSNQTGHNGTFSLRNEMEQSNKALPIIHLNIIGKTLSDYQLRAFKRSFDWLQTKRTDLRTKLRANTRQAIMETYKFVMQLDLKTLIPVFSQMWFFLAGMVLSIVVYKLLNCKVANNDTIFAKAILREQVHTLNEFTLPPMMFVQDTWTEFGKKYPPFLKKTYALNNKVYKMQCEFLGGAPVYEPAYLVLHFNKIARQPLVPLQHHSTQGRAAYIYSNCVQISLVLTYLKYWETVFGRLQRGLEVMHNLELNFIPSCQWSAPLLKKRVEENLQLFDSDFQRYVRTSFLEFQQRVWRISHAYLQSNGFPTLGQRVWNYFEVLHVAQQMETFLRWMPKLTLHFLAKSVDTAQAYADLWNMMRERMKYNAIFMQRFDEINRARNPASPATWKSSVGTSI